MNVQAAHSATVDLATIKARQPIAWGSGDHAVVSTTLQTVDETLCEAVSLRGNQRVLDVAAGSGNATLTAARRFADVVSADYVGALLERGRKRAEAEGCRERDDARLPPRRSAGRSSSATSRPGAGSTSSAPTTGRS